MIRVLVVVAAAVLLLAAAAPPALAQQAPAGERGRQGPDALWDAFPLQDRPSPAEAEAQAQAGPGTRDRVTFVERGTPDGPSPLYAVVGACLCAGILLLGAGLLRARPLTLRRGRRPENRPETSS
jgi:hypothetical protein